MLLTMDKGIMKHAFSQNKQYVLYEMVHTALTPSRVTLTDVCLCICRFWTLSAEYQIIVGGGVSSSRHGLNATLFLLVRTELPINGYSLRSTKRVRSGTPLVGAKKQGTEAKRQLAKATRVHTPAKRADALSKSGSYREAIKAWSGVLAEGGNAATCRLKIAIAYTRLKELPRALEEINVAIGCFGDQIDSVGHDKSPAKTIHDYATATSCRAQILWAMDELEQAVEGFERALTISPKCTAAKHKLQECRRRIAVGASGEDRYRGALPQ